MSIDGAHVVHPGTPVPVTGVGETPAHNVASGGPCQRLEWRALPIAYRDLPPDANLPTGGHEGTLHPSADIADVEVARVAGVDKFATPNSVLPPRHEDLPRWTPPELVRLEGYCGNGPLRLAVWVADAAYEPFIALVVGPAVDLVSIGPIWTLPCVPAVVLAIVARSNSVRCLNRQRSLRRCVEAEQLAFNRGLCECLVIQLPVV